MTPDEMPAISRRIWEDKYRFKMPDGSLAESSVEETFARVALALSKAEPTEAERWAIAFYGAMKGFEFVPAGRIIAGAGTDRDVTLMNCLAAETKVLTREYGEVEISTLAGTCATVIDGNGNWVSVPFVCFGTQKLHEVRLTHGMKNQSILATAGHAWLVDGERLTTAQLRNGDRLDLVVRPRDVADQAVYQQGVIHGFIYGDGSIYNNGGFGVRICKGKEELHEFFTEYPSNSPPTYEGDLGFRIVRERAWTDLKSLPSPEKDHDYLVGFIRGWFAADGCVDERSQASICVGPDEAEWLWRFGPIVGFYFRSWSELSAESGFGERRNKRVGNLGVDTRFITASDLIRSKHTERLRITPRMSDLRWRVSRVSKEPVKEALVYCATVPSTRSFVLTGNVLTGNCYTMGTIGDDMGSIFDHLREAALTMQQGGGIGYDFSTLRPHGVPVKGVGADASGPLPFMDVWDAMCRTIMSAGYRRGAMMATLRCDHPDVREFVRAKTDGSRLRMFNLSVLITDAFMEAVEADSEWPLVFDGTVYRTVRARELWDEILRTTYEYAEPGVIFIDRVNRRNNLWYCEKIATCNPCAEQPMGPYSACNLGSINLAALVRHPFEPRAHLDLDRLDELVPLAVRMLDDVYDVTRFPLEAQRVEAMRKRRVGLGVMGLADALAMCGLRYGSPEAVSKTAAWLCAIEELAYRASTDLAAERGPFPAFDVQAYAGGVHFAGLSEATRRAIITRGLRNSHLTSIAPTGTISNLSCAVSGGIEPFFSLSYRRRVLQPDGSTAEELVEPYAVALWRRLRGDEPLPECFVTAQTLTPVEHLKMLAIAQRHSDSGVSKTVNLPESISFEDFRSVYTDAYAMNCKSCTTYRPSAARGAVLVDASPTQEAAEAEAAEPAASWVEAERITDEAMARHPIDLVPARPDALSGRTYKLRWNDGDRARSYYLTVNRHDDRLFEAFVQTLCPDHRAWSDALMRMISAIYRRGGPTGFVAEELKEIVDPRGGCWVGGRYVTSLPALIGEALERAAIEAAATLTTEAPAADRPLELPDGPIRGTVGELCPRCHQPTIVHEMGCASCTSCQWSRCG